MRQVFKIGRFDEIHEKAEQQSKRNIKYISNEIIGSKIHKKIATSTKMNWFRHEAIKHKKTTLIEGHNSQALNPANKY